MEYIIDNVTYTLGELREWYESLSYEMNDPDLDDEMESKLLSRMDEIQDLVGESIVDKWIDEM